jgi:hypothetical protein
MSKRTFSFSDLDTQKNGKISMAEYNNGFEILEHEGENIIKISDFDEKSQRFFYAIKSGKSEQFLSFP